MGRDTFFSKIPAFKNPSGVSNPNNYFKAPPDWLLFMADVTASTQAIQEGRYKDVNIVGVSCISAVKNACKDLDLPFVFGGDGATFLAPPDSRPQIISALQASQQMARREFMLDLRISMIPLQKLQTEGHELKVGRYQVSPHLSLAVFSGGALKAAETWIKDSSRSREFLIQDSHNETANFQGLECRWSPIANTKGEILSVLIQSHPKLSQQRTFEVYKEILEELELIVGSFHELLPLKSANLNLTPNPLSLRSENQVYNSQNGPGTRLKNLILLSVKTLLGSIFMLMNRPIFATNWKLYKEKVSQHSDFWKFDDTLRFVADLGPVQKRALIASLEAHKNRNEIVYGIHSSREALMTCLVADRESNHVHFIDGGDGGFAQAALQLKSQLKGS